MWENILNIVQWNREWELIYDDSCECHEAYLKSGIATPLTYIEKTEAGNVAVSPAARLLTKIDVELQWK